jgi:hypothetical protein
MDWKTVLYYNLLAWVKMFNILLALIIFAIPFFTPNIADAWCFLFWAPALWCYEELELERKRLCRFMIKGKKIDE